MNTIKHLFFLSHYLFIIYVLYPFSKYNTEIAILICISWLLNNNYCLISQIEYKFFGETYISKRLAKVRPIDKAILLSSQICKFILL
jgi:hypothetical protein